MGIICFFKGHNWEKIGENHTEERDFGNPMLWEPPHTIIDLQCSRCGFITEADHIEWWPGLYTQISGPRKK